MERSNKRGKIPQSDWPLIMARYEAGETLASIARTYDCSPPAISYVVSRSRARPPGASLPAQAAIVETQPQLVKATVEAGNGRAPEHVAPATPQPQALTTAATPSGPESILRAIGDSATATPRRDMPDPRQANGSRTPAADRVTPFPGLPPGAAPPSRPPAGQSDGDHRRTLHLSLGQPPSGNGGGIAAAEPQSAAERRSVGDLEATAGPARAAPDPTGAERNGDHHARSFAEAPPVAYQAVPRTGEPQGEPRRDGGGSFIDHQLRERVDGDINAFLAAFDAALLQDTQESRSALREATDRLLRAGARTRIELERLEARLPLPSRAGGRDEPAWRHR